MRLRPDLLPALLVGPLLLLCGARPVFAARAPAAETVVKLATLVPEGSVWEKALRTMATEVKQATEGRVTLRIYPGGVAGDEPDIVRKMRVGQLQGGTLTSTGLGYLDEGFKILEVPMYFESDEEVAHVLEALAPVMSERLERKGWIFLNWGHTGWVRFFTTEPASSVEEFKRLKLFVWAGDDGMLAFWKQNGFRPVPLAITDALTGLQTGMIQAMPSTPLASLSLQWFRHAPHMIDTPVLALMGATVIDAKTWKKLEPRDREALRAAGRRMEAFLASEVPLREREALEEMSRRGLTIHEQDVAEERGWREVAGLFAATMKESRVPVEVFRVAEGARAAFRAGEPGDGGH